MLIVWSGGYDSTLVLADALRNHQGDSHGIRTISINHPQVINSNIQKLTRVKLREQLGKFPHLEVDVTHAGDFEIDPQNGSCYQSIMWISIVVSYLKNDESLCFGYVRHDDFWHNRESFWNIYDNMRYRLGLQNTKLVFPLEWETKADVYKRMQKHGLLNIPWVCGEPLKKRNKFVSCNNCTPCHRHLDAMKTLKSISVTTK